MGTLRISFSRDQSLWKSLALILLFNGALFLWLLIKPGTYIQFVAVDNLMQMAGILISSFFCFQGLGSLWRCNTPYVEKVPSIYQRQQWIPILSGVGILGGFSGQSILTYYAHFFHHATAAPSWIDALYLVAYPFWLPPSADIFYLITHSLMLPSLTDAFYLISYPFLPSSLVNAFCLITCPFILVGLFLLPTRPDPNITRSRILTESLMMATVIVIFLWFFILAPMFQLRDGTNLTKFIGAVYPFSDMLVASSLLMIAFRYSNSKIRSVVVLLSFAIAIIIITDSTLEYRILQGTFAMGSLFDVGWPLSYMLIGLAVRTYSRNKEQQSLAQALSQDALSDVPSIWRALMPYVHFIIVALLIYYMNVFETQNHIIAVGVYIGGITLISLVLIRQILSLREIIQAHRLIQESNDALELANVCLASLATTDVLTGLPNHRALQTLLEQESERTNRSGCSLSLLFFDGDHFKQVNDMHGHAVGDIVLRELGERAKSALRAGDTVGRFGGEEFLVLLPETDEQEAKVVAERLRATVAARPLASDAVAGGIAVTVSIGVASYPSDGATISEVREQADQAMYWAKRLGRNQVRTAAEAIRANQDAVLKATTAHTLKRLEVTPLDGRDHESQVRAEQLGLIYSLMGALDVREPGMSTHAHEVSDLVAGMARILQFDDQHALQTATAAFLHDIGKIALPDRLLQQPRPSLSPQEWRLLRRHAELGAAIVEASTWLSDLAPAIRHHHEHWDGTGVPDGLAGSAIPLEARLIAMAEAYHAMISDRPYQAARSPAEALDEIERCVGSQFDPELLPTFRTVLAQWQVASIPLVDYAEQELRSTF